MTLDDQSNFKNCPVMLITNVVCSTGGNDCCRFHRLPSLPHYLLTLLEQTAPSGFLLTKPFLKCFVI